MTAFSDAIAARYAARESGTDEFGRTIEVARLRPAAAMRVRVLVGSDLPSIVTEALVAASVRAITTADGKRTDLDPPQTSRSLDIIMDTLDAEGMGAAVLAFSRLEGVEQEVPPKPAVEPGQPKDDAPQDPKSATGCRRGKATPAPADQPGAAPA